MLNIFMLCIVVLGITRHAKCLIFNRCAECRYSECHYSECRGAPLYRGTLEVETNLIKFSFSLMPTHKLLQGSFL
jgi:hypothetical protein